jgi:dephospho-CoA kinase
MNLSFFDLGLETWNFSMLRVGLTGSIAVGKSFVSAVLKELGCHVIDADRLARAVVEPNSAGLRAVVEKFGAGVLAVDGSLDRKKLGAIVFADAEKRAALEAILHPLIFAAQEQALREIEEKDPRAVAVVDAALMIETGSDRRFDKIIVVWCEPEIQIARLMRRDQITREEALKRIGAQMPQDEKKKRADFLIDTSRGFEDARAQAADIVAELRARAERS